MISRQLGLIYSFGCDVETWTSGRFSLKGWLVSATAVDGVKFLEILVRNQPFAIYESESFMVALIIIIIFPTADSLFLKKCCQTKESFMANS